MPAHRRHVLLLRREDHKRDALGAIFLGAITDPDEASAYIKRYLDPALDPISVVLDDDVLQVTVDSTGFDVESQNLVRLGRGLLEQGRPRGAMDMFRESLQLDPLNVDALKEIASIMAHRGQHERAVDLWIRASEIRGYDGEMLRGLADAALRAGRTPSAQRYLEEALIVNPDDSESQRVLDEINRQTELRFQRDKKPESP